MIDFSIDNYNITAQDEVTNIMQQIDILFNTSPYEVIGEASFGTDFEKYIHELKVPNRDIEAAIISAIRNNVYLFGYNLDVHVYIAQGTVNDIIFADIVIYDDKTEYSKQYRITD